ncbi:glutathione S-transferase protein [Onchocerca flexuosa]|uniref:glutathione transferase n=2 Tax=Onchocerca flexuosa TaxID=387005 RepID=A0A183GZG6_9BILA|nr:glutathione S-transferase protein [Onchocerca flexuosa]VDO26457.1 unnamed protein product [Onchocerca flexuosa]
MTVDILLPKFKLYNFNDQRNDKLVKLIFKMANIPYEDINISRKEQWNAIKNETPLGTLPVLEMDGVKLSGQTSICRHLAWRFGLSGQSATSDALLDMFADLLLETQILVFGPMDDNNDSNTNVIIVDDINLEKICDRVASIIEKQLIKNNTSFLIGEQVTWVDLMTYIFFNSLMDHGKNVNLDKHPSVKNMYKKISQLAELKNCS